MNNTYHFDDGRILESTKMIKERFGVTWPTLNRWAKKKLISPPVRLGRVNYYDRKEVEKRMSTGE